MYSFKNTKFGEYRYIFFSSPDANSLMRSWRPLEAFVVLATYYQISRYTRRILSRSS